MTKLYNYIDGELLYWECWLQGERSLVTHWGRVGHKGSTEIIDAKYAEEEINAFLQRGYVRFEEMETGRLVIEYAIDGMGTPGDLDKRHAVENRMDELLGWTGLGLCEGGSIGAGTMEIACAVVDVKIAQPLVEQDLVAAGLADFTRIYCQ